MLKLLEPLEKFLGLKKKVTTDIKLKGSSADCIIFLTIHNFLCETESQRLCFKTMY